MPLEYKDFAANQFRTYNVADYGLVGDGTTDNTTALQTLVNTVVAAGGGTIFFPKGKYLFSGPLQETANANSVIKFPSVPMTQPCVVVKFKGVLPPPIQFFNFSNQVPEAGYSVLKCTLTGGTGTASFISGTTEVIALDGTTQNNIAFHVEDLIFEAPPNPSFTMIHMQKHQANIMKNVLIHCGTVNLDNIVQPTHSHAYGFTCPEWSHTPFNYYENVIVFGYYWGTRISENTTFNGVRMWKCYKGVACASGYHKNNILDIGIYHTPYPFVAVGGSPDNICRMNVLHYDMEVKLGGEWYAQVYEVDDPNNWIKGFIYYMPVTAGTGENSNLFSKNGGRNFLNIPHGGTHTGWTTANRPTLPVFGTTGVNTDLGKLEYWNGTAWV
jgi:hypothetical protein